MRALVCREYGEPETLQLEERPVPEVQVDEVLVRVCCTSINDWDWSYVRGKPFLYRLFLGLRRPKDEVLGTEVAGVVERVGSGVSDFSPGERVYGDLSESGFGAFAEYVAPPAAALGKMPEGMSFEDAVCFPHAAGLAYQALFDLGELKEGQRLLINGGGGGVGALALQLAKARGCEVTGVDTGSKLERMRALGFDRVVDYLNVDFTGEGERYDLVLDAKSQHGPWRYTRTLKSGGRYVSVGGRLDKILLLALFGGLVGMLTGKKLGVLALKVNQDLPAVRRDFENGVFSTVVDGPYELSEVPSALRRFGDAKHEGKVVIRVSQ